MLICNRAQGRGGILFFYIVQFGISCLWHHLVLISTAWNWSIQNFHPLYEIWRKRLFWYSLFFLYGKNAKIWPKVGRFVLFMFLYADLKILYIYIDQLRGALKKKYFIKLRLWLNRGGGSDLRWTSFNILKKTTEKLRHFA